MGEVNVSERDDKDLAEGEEARQEKDADPRPLEGHQLTSDGLDCLRFQHLAP
jgi:hypothetical protein